MMILTYGRYYTHLGVVSVASCLLGGLFVWGFFGWWHVPSHNGAPPQVSTTSVFRESDCVVHRGAEAWESYVDGIVWKVGQEHYLIVPTPIAERMVKDHHTERFDARTLPRAWVDQWYEKTVCPKAWAKFFPAASS